MLRAQTKINVGVYKDNSISHFPFTTKQKGNMIKSYMFVYSDNKQCLLNMNLEFTFHIIMYTDICSQDLDMRLDFSYTQLLSAAVKKDLLNCCIQQDIFIWHWALL